MSTLVAGNPLVKAFWEKLTQNVYLRIVERGQWSAWPPDDSIVTPVKVI